MYDKNWNAKVNYSHHLKNPSIIVYKDIINNFIDTIVACQIKIKTLSGTNVNESLKEF